MRILINMDYYSFEPENDNAKKGNDSDLELDNRTIALEDSLLDNCGDDQVTISMDVSSVIDQINKDIQIKLTNDELDGVKKYHYYKGLKIGILASGSVFSIILVILIIIFATR